MIGFELLHGGGMLLVFAAFVSLLWPVATVIAAAVRRSLGSTATKVLLATYVVGLALMCLPYGFWIRTFIHKFSPAQSVSLMIHASADGDVSTVRAFLRRGVDVNASHEGSNALQAAAIQGRIELMELLVASGADIKSVNLAFEEVRRSVQRLNERTKWSHALDAWWQYNIPPLTLTQSTTYDGYSRPATATYPSGLSVRFNYDATGGVQSIANAASNALYFERLDFDARGNITKSRLGNGVGLVEIGDSYLFLGGMRRQR
jgi:hypothetical protein